MSTTPDRGDEVDIDVTAWAAADVEQIGTKPKQWLYEEGTADRRWLWKPRTVNPGPDDTHFFKGDDWAECVGSDLARALEMPAPEVRLARRDGLLGSISLDFTASMADAELQHGNVLMGIDAPDSSEGIIHNDPRYTLEGALSALQDIGPPQQDSVLNTAHDWFAGYLLFDAWIGNTDRHHQNWGAIAAPELSVPILAPSYDHASSLGFLIRDEERLTRLKADPADSASVESWAERAGTPFADFEHPDELATAALSKVSAEAAKEWGERLRKAAQKADAVLDTISDHRISTASRDFALRLLAHNASRLMSSEPLRMSS